MKPQAFVVEIIGTFVFFSILLNVVPKKKVIPITSGNINNQT